MCVKERGDLLLSSVHGGHVSKTVFGGQCAFRREQWDGGSQRSDGAVADLSPKEERLTFPKAPFRR